MLAAIVTACGGYVPMISGRGLGHTGGTADKLESIAGFNVQPSLDDFKEVVADLGMAIISQTPELAPADRRLYSIRDVTAIKAMEEEAEHKNLEIAIICQLINISSKK